uniref:Uncharacterized protein n=1 Tax=Panagrolaimus sp. ES5 TaxID=591445 RepID=A0AC34F377_9BILA
MKLIVFDKRKNVTYFGECMIQIDREEKRLNIKKLDKVPEETMTSKYERNYICKSNFFCCKDKDSKDAFILVFPTRGKVESFINAILRVEVLQPQTSNAADIKEEKMFKDEFFIPLIKAVRSVINGHAILKALILKFINSLEIEERLCYFNILANITLIPALSLPTTTKANINARRASLHHALNPKTRKRSMKDLGKDEEQEDVTPPKNPNLSNYVADVSPSNLNESYSAETSASNLNVPYFDVPSPQNSSADVYFDIVEYEHDGKMDRKLLVFTSSEQKQCYEFVFNRIKCCYRCIKCLAQKKHTEIKAIIHDDGSKTFDFNEEEHECYPIHYAPENYLSLIIKSPNYQITKSLKNGKMFRTLIIFADEEKNMCYQLGFDSYEKQFCCGRCKKLKKTILARFIQHNGETAVELNRLQHFCEPQKYILDTF